MIPHDEAIFKLGIHEKLMEDSMRLCKSQKLEGMVMKRFSSGEGESSQVRLGQQSRKEARRSH